MLAIATIVPRFWSFQGMFPPSSLPLKIASLCKQLKRKIHVECVTSIRSKSAKKSPFKAVEARFSRFRSHNRRPAGIRQVKALRQVGDISSSMSSKSAHREVNRLCTAAVALAALVIQAISSGFFPGSNRGFNLPVSAVSFIAWSYRGLLQNEFEYRPPHLWGCPGASILAIRVCSLICTACPCQLLAYAVQAFPLHSMNLSPS